VNTARLKRKAREAIAIEDRHGRPSGGHYLYHGSAIVASVLIEAQWRPVQDSIRWAMVAIDPPKWTAFPIALGLMALGVFLFWNRHAPLYRFRWYRRTFRYGSAAHAIARWSENVVLLLWGWMIIVVMMEIGIGKR